MKETYFKTMQDFMKKNNKLLLLILVNIVIEIIVLIFFAPTFETNDDFGMSIISSGFYGGENQKFLVFSNVVLGFILEFLTKIANGVAWYINIQYILLFLAVVTTFFVVSKFLSFYFTIILNFLFWYVNFFWQVRFIQFTRTAAFITVAGCMMLCYALHKDNIKQKIWGYVLIAFGICVRKNCAAICLVFFVAMGAAICLKQKSLINFKKFLFNVSIIFSIYVILSAIDYCAYMDADWKNYTAYNQARSRILDGGIPSYEQNEEKYKSIGFSANDVNVLANWIFADNSKYSMKNLQTIASWCQRKQIDGDFIKTSISDFLKRNYTNKLLYTYFAVLIICIIYEKRCRLFAVANIFLFIGMESYLYYSGHVVERVEYAITISALSSLTFLFWYLHYDFKAKQQCFKMNFRRTIATILFVTFSIWNLWFCEYTNYKPGTPMDSVGLQCLEKLSYNTDKIYMLNTLSFHEGITFIPYKKTPKWWFSNFEYCGGWTIESPLYKYHIKKLGLKNPMQDMLYKDSVYYVKNSGEDVSMELTYFQENYCVNANAEPVEQMDGYTIWKFYVGSSDN